MSYLQELNQKNRAELADIAKDYGIAVAKKTKSQIAEEIFRFESGLGDSQAEIGEPKVKKVVKDDGDLQIVKFTGINDSFQTGDYVFSRENPYLAVPGRIASHVYKKWPAKFRPASPDEVKSYYS